MSDPERAGRGTTYCCNNWKPAADQTEDVRVETCPTCYALVGLHFTWHTNFGGEFDAE